MSPAASVKQPKTSRPRWHRSQRQLRLRNADTEAETKAETKVETGAKARASSPVRWAPHGYHRFAENIATRHQPQAWGIGGAHSSVHALRRSLGEAHCHVTIEIRAGESKRLRRAVRQVCDSGGDDVASPGVFDGHCDAEFDA